jgi:integrase
MPIERLSIKDVKDVEPHPSGKLVTLHDGGGLLLMVRPGKTGPLKHWVFRYAVPGGGRGGRERRMGLGPEHDYSLAEARQMAQDARKLLRRGIDPLDAKAERTASQRAAKAAAVTFNNAAEAYLAAHEASWRNPIHRKQWRASLRDHVSPTIGELDVATITMDDVLRVLTPIWRVIPETANRVRGRIEAVLDFAGRNGSNPAKWEGLLEFKLAKPNKARSVKHYKALPWSDMAAFMAELRAVDDIAARALEFTILCATRTTETVGATWSELDLCSKLWTIPIERLKRPGEQEDGSHCIPLSDRAVEILREMKKFVGGSRVFPGLGEGALRYLLKKLRPVTVHGMRACFRSWAGSCTTHPRDVCEMALGHPVGSASERAYMRDALLAKRRVLMADWGLFCSGKPIPAEQRG